MTRYKPIILIALSVFLVFVTISFLAITSPNRRLATPDLIQLAAANGKITEEERLLYLAYALSDYEKLPTQFYAMLRGAGH